MYPVWTAVKVKTEGAEREGQAGVVHATSPEHPTEAAVKFDLDGAIVACLIADLQAL
jgi:hypothetical protein